MPLVLASLMLLAGIATARLADLRIGQLALPYFSSAGACTLLTLLVAIFAEVVRLGRHNAPDPYQKVRERFLGRLPLLALPALAFPAFLVGFTAAKSAIPFLVGYSWDGFWADVDLFIFRTDPWRLTHWLFGSGSLWFWQWFYAVGWGAAFYFSAAAIPLYGSRRFVSTFFATVFSTWLIGGFFLAYWFSAAGPVFAQMFDPSLTARFAPLRTELGTKLAGGPIGLTQNYLAGAVHSHVAVMGGGISAMPSMHLATAAIYVIAARGTKWLGPCVLFWLIIFIGSAYFGYHYWIDGFAGTAVAYICWKASSWTIGKFAQGMQTAWVAPEPS